MFIAALLVLTSRQNTALWCERAFPRLQMQEHPVLLESARIEEPLRRILSLRVNRHLIRERDLVRHEIDDLARYRCHQRLASRRGRVFSSQPFDQN